MLEPHQRSLLTDMLQPPRGYALACAVGTTFTLNLATALSIPLSFASRNIAMNDDVGILAALAQFTDRITLFTQAGHISQGDPSELVALLEDVIHPVNPPVGIFHPKVWFLEYEPHVDDARNTEASGGDPDQQRVYRFLCLSRNLTEDRSWDLSVRLDGTISAPENRAACSERNQPLVKLLHRMQELTVAELPAARAEQVDTLADRISAVEWQLPSGVSDIKFHLLDGSDQSSSNGSAMLNTPARDALVISPFVSGPGLDAALADVSQRCQLISRPDGIDQLPSETLSRSVETFVLDDLLTEVEGVEPGELSGLHAKAVFIRNRRYNSQAQALIGSANMTAGGLWRNLEVMVELHGHHKNLGPEVVMEALRPMLESYASTGGQEPSAVEEESQAMHAQLRSIAAGTFHVAVTRGDPYGARIWCEPQVQRRVHKLSEQGIGMGWKLLTQPGLGDSIPTEEGESSQLHRLQLTDITPFLELTATQRISGREVSVSTIVSAELHHDVRGRRDAILAHGIADTEAFFNLLALLLNAEGPGLVLGVAGDEASGTWNTTGTFGALFESLLKSLARGDDGLDVVHRILSEINSQPGHQVELPAGFTELWGNVWATRQRQKGVNS